MGWIWAVVGLLAGLAVGLTAGVAAAPRLRRWIEARRYPRHGPSHATLLGLVVDDSPTGIAVVDGAHHVVLANRRASELGLVVDDALDDRAWAAARKALAEHDPVDFDLMADQRRKSRSVSVRGQAQVLDDRVGRYALLFADDDSEIVRMESARRDFVANVSHELKTPVGAMGLLAEALLESADDPETVRHFGRKVQSEATRLGAMVSELIALSRLQGAEKLPNLEVVSVDEIVAEALNNAELAAGTAEIEITADEPSGLEVLGDEMLLTTALTNLISNAVNYSPEGAPVSVERAVRRGQVQISVTDHGIGIAPKHQERVFERFFRVDKARSRETGGTGLGLAIVKHVAINHNGRIRLWSKQGTGSTFTLELPARTPGSAGSAGAGQGAQPQTSPGQASQGQASQGQASQGQASQGQGPQTQASQGQASQGQASASHSARSQGGQTPPGRSQSGQSQPDRPQPGRGRSAPAPSAQSPGASRGGPDDHREDDHR